MYDGEVMPPKTTTNPRSRVGKWKAVDIAEFGNEGVFLWKFYPRD